MLERQENIYKQVEKTDYPGRLRRPTDSRFLGLKYRYFPGGPKSKI